MEYRQLGNSGVRVSVIGLGTNQFGGVVDQQGVNNIIDNALELGINFIDTADVYTQSRSEETLGVALKGKWDKVVLATKFVSAMGDGPNDRGASRYHIANAVDASLKRLQTDHIDLYQVHRWDASTPIEETLRTLNDLVSAGKIRYIGASNFAAWQLARANLFAELRGWEPFITIQPHYHMLERSIEAELVPYCNAYNVGILPYFPLAGGFLTGKYRRNEAIPSGSRAERSPYVTNYMTDSNYDKIEKLEAWASERSHSLGELAHTWLLAQPRVSSVISGATRVDQIKLNAAAANWQLTPEEFTEVNEILA
jgi:aryl-alcohol dehydrogenase-like predicted oxidoreductase